MIEIEKSDDLCLDDPSIYSCVSTEGLELDCAKVGLDAHLLAYVAKDEPSTFEKDSLSDYCRFAQILMSLPSKV